MTGSGEMLFSNCTIYSATGSRIQSRMKSHILITKYESFDKAIDLVMLGIMILFQPREI